MKDPNQVAEKWARNLGQATEDIRRGVEGVQQAPGVKAAQQAQKYINRTQAAVPKWQQRVAAVSLGDWQQSVITKGLPRIAAGAQAAQPKMTSFMNQLLPHVERGRQAIQSMPSTTVEDGIARSAAFIRHMANFRRG